VKNFENRSISGEDMDKTFWLLTGPTYILFKTCLELCFEQVCDLSVTSYRHFSAKVWNLWQT